MTAARAFAQSVVVTPHHLASAAGAAVLEGGGNAVDAAVAANLALGVVCPYYCGVGGDLLAMVWDGTLRGYRSTGRSASAASADEVRSAKGERVARMPVMGPHTVTVPGAVRGWFDLLARWGTRSFGEVAAAAIRLADEGVLLSRPGASRLRGSVELAALFCPDSSDLAAAYGGLEPGGVLRQRALARTLELLASDGPAAMYGGPIGDAVAADVQRHGGRLALEDLASHRGSFVEPLLGRFADVEVAELPPPTQGVTALQMFALADDPVPRKDGPDRWHSLIEIAAAALAERDRLVADPDHMTVEPAEMLRAESIGQLRARIDPQRAGRWSPRPQTDGGTAYLCCADRDGLLVSLIQSNFTALGSGIHVREWGINLHNRGAGFSLDPASPNVLAGSKLPLHTLIPAMELRDGAPSLVFGTMGGQAQAQIHLQLMVRRHLDGEDPQGCVDAPRFAVAPEDGSVGIERRLPDAWLAELGRRGHDIRLHRPFDDGMGHAHAIEVTANGYFAAADARAESAALGR